MTRIYVSAAPWEPEVWVIERPYARQTSVGLLEVPAGFHTDLASTPRTVWRMFPKFGRWFGAAVVHDWIYRTKPDGVTRWSADWVFRELLREDGVYYGVADAMYKAVRAFGESAWRSAPICKGGVRPLPTSVIPVPPNGGSGVPLICAVFAAIMLGGCVGMVNDYATAANAFGEQATLNTIIRLQQKHDTELAAYMAAVCGQPRAGALMRRFSDDELRRYFEFCREQRRF